jgi:dienelactone hydrolase
MNQSRRKFFSTCAVALAGAVIAKAIPGPKKREKVDLLIHVRTNDSRIVDVVKRNHLAANTLKSLGAKAEESSKTAGEVASAINKFERQLIKADG